jgi:hypothetical protein
LGFLFSLAFTDRFSMLDATHRSWYVVALVLGVSGTGLIMAPTAMHRLTIEWLPKSHLLTLSSRCVLGGLTMLALSIIGAVTLVLDVVVGVAPSMLLAVGVLGWFSLLWCGIPLWLRIRHRTAPRSAMELESD